MAVRDGKWRCPYCSGVNRGSAMACLGCGATRDKDVTYRMELPEARWAALPPGQSLSAVIRGGRSVLELGP
jgi:hypothetical protein